IDTGHRLVVVKCSADPAAAHVSGADIAEAVVDSAIESDVRAPVARMEAIDAPDEAPVARGPEQPHLRRCDPGTRDPVIATGCVGPVARGPDVALHGARRL